VRFQRRETRGHETLEAGVAAGHRVDARADAHLAGTRQAAIAARRDQQIEHARQRGVLLGGKPVRRFAHGVLVHSKRFERFFLIVSAT
jgi:hypothetical protein